MRLSDILSITKILNVAEPPFTRGGGFWSSPADEKAQGVFGKLTDFNSQRENWYAVTPYIAEFFCAISNAGFFYVALKHKSPELLFAGCASLISHSIPKQWLLTVDKIGVLVAASKLVREHKVLAKNPWLLCPVALAGIINIADAYLARHRGFTWPHVVWHLSSAYIANMFLNQVSLKTS